MDGTQAARAVCGATGAWFCGFESARCHVTQSRRAPAAALALAYRSNMTIQVQFSLLPLTVVTLVVVMLRPAPSAHTRHS